MVFKRMFFEPAVQIVFGTCYYLNNKLIVSSLVVNSLLSVFTRSLPLHTKLPF